MTALETPLTNAEATAQLLADMALGKGFSAKKARGGSTPFDQSSAGA